MSKWNEASKLCVAGYCVLLYVASGSGNIELNTCIYLTCLSLNLACLLMKNKRASSAIKMMLIVILVVSAAELNQIYALMLPPVIEELMKERMGATSLFSILLGSFLLKDYDMKCSFIFITLMSFIIFYIGQRADKKLRMLIEENDRLKENNYRLSLKIDKDESFNNQLKYTSELEVRNQIAQEIHDEIGHTLAGSLMQLEAAKLLINTDAKKTKDLMQNVINALRDGMERIRSSVRNIKPPLEQLGLNRIKLLTDQAAVETNMDVRLLSNGNMNFISYEYWRIIYDSVKEALTNAMKHSKATKILVSIQVLNKLVKIEVKDNGTGSLKINRGMGISGMEERCGAVDGKVIVDGKDGFSVILLLPIK